MITAQPPVKTPEILAPAGNPEKLQTALLYGADAVYLGGETFNLRAACDGFSRQDIHEAVSAAEARGARIFLTLNAMPMQRDMRDVPASIEAAAEAGVHALIIADPGVLRLARRHAPGVEIHLSTQANTTNAESIAFWADQGVKRVNLARELCCRDIYTIRKALPHTELEVFVHGAMCLAVSGQCLLSAWLNNRPANLGRCTHPCRFEYRSLGVNTAPKGCTACQDGVSLAVAEATRPDSPAWMVEEDEAYSSFWAPQDLCLISYLPWFIRTGVNSLKIEGRMKGASYVAHVVDAYRTAMAAARHAATHGGGYDCAPFMDELTNTATRPLGSGFFLPGERRNFAESGTGDRGKTFGRRPLLAKLGEAVDPGAGLWRVQVLGTWRDDMAVELMLPGLRRPRIPGHGYAFENHRGEHAHLLQSGTQALLHLEHDGLENCLEKGIFIRGVM